MNDDGSGPDPDTGLEGRVALVTGGGGSLGSSICAVLAELGLRIVVAGRNLARAGEVADRYPGAVAEELDVTSLLSWRSARGRIEAAAGPVDVLVASAGVITRVPFLASDPSSWEAMIETNLEGMLNGAWSLVPTMVERGFGRVVAVSSVTAHRGCDGRVVYGATKAALEAFCRGLAVEVAGTGVTVNCVAPGAVRTEFNAQYLAPGTPTGEATLASIPERRFGKPVEVAAAVGYLVQAGYCQGATLKLDGGWSIRG